jgi:GNAT superfamily N-acetyltransferase
MAVDENARGRGYGSRILKGLEAEAVSRCLTVVLNARDNATEFYAKHGYAVLWRGQNPFGGEISPCADGRVIIFTFDNEAISLTTYARLVNVVNVCFGEFFVLG